jgi:hypothetical protein
MTDHRKRSRLVLLLLAVLFAAPVVAAIVLHAIGWEPTRTRNHGTLLQPPPDLRDLVLRRADGTPYDWAPRDRRWRIAVVPPAGCERSCVDLVASLDKVWQLQGRHADRLDVLWFGGLPAGAVPFRRLVAMRPDAAFAARLPDAQPNAKGEPPLYLLDPSGFLAMRYAPGADVAGVREDVARLLK